MLVLTLKTEAIETQIEELSQKVTSQCDEIYNLTTETKLNKVIEELTKQNKELINKTEGLESQMERLVNQNELFTSQILEKMNQFLSPTSTTSVLYTATSVPDNGEANTATDSSLNYTFPSDNELSSKAPRTSMSQTTNPTTETAEVTTATVSSIDTEYLPENCQDIYALGNTSSGVYTIYEPWSAFKASRNLDSNRKAIDVFCDQDNANGGPGWLVFQRRQDDSVSFNRTWNEYRDGFGNLTSNVWLGNQNIAIITGSDTAYKLRIDLEDWSNETRHALYSTVRVLNESQQFQLQLGEYSGNAGGDSMRLARNMNFSTPDMDNDAWSSVHCAQGYSAGFWFSRCAWASLNNPYRNPTDSVRGGLGIVWDDWHGWYYSLKAVQMKIRPV